MVPLCVAQAPPFCGSFVRCQPASIFDSALFHLCSRSSRVFAGRRFSLPCSGFLSTLAGAQMDACTWPQPGCCAVLSLLFVHHDDPVFPGGRHILAEDKVLSLASLECLAQRLFAFNRVLSGSFARFSERCTFTDGCSALRAPHRFPHICPP